MEKRNACQGVVFYNRAGEELTDPKTRMGRRPRRPATNGIAERHRCVGEGLAPAAMKDFVLGNGGTKA